jgi:hypothetical protein
MTETAPSERQYNILAFGIEKLRLPVPAEPIRGRNFSIFFESYGTPRRFHEYDGVVVFQGIFEKFERKSNYMDSYLSHEYDVDELDKRKKEARLLLGQGGFLCFLLTDPFLDQDRGRDFSGTDLAKYHLNYSHFYRENFRDRAAHVKPTLDEFKRFLEVFGAASSYFKNHNDSLECRVLATVGQAPVGLLLERAEYFIPSLKPDARPEVVSEYFNLLIDAITSIHNKLHVVVPDWAAEFQFSEEALLAKERAALLKEISGIDHRLEQLTAFKAALVQTGPELVSNVSAMLTAALGLKVDNVDEFREDVKLIGEDGKVIAVCEVKGINRGVKRENVNQTDSHRERSGFGAEFPAILIANTNIKAARSLAEKNQEIAAEQVKHAVHMRVLVMRTIDLLGLLRLVLGTRQTPESARALVFSNIGWLRVEGDDVSVLTGE